MSGLPATVLSTTCSHLTYSYEVSMRLPALAVPYEVCCIHTSIPEKANGARAQPPSAVVARTPTPLPPVSPMRRSHEPHRRLVASIVHPPIRLGFGACFRGPGKLRMHSRVEHLEITNVSLSLSPPLQPTTPRGHDSGYTVRCCLRVATWAVHVIRPWTSTIQYSSYQCYMA